VSLGAAHIYSVECGRITSSHAGFRSNSKQLYEREVVLEIDAVQSLEETATLHTRAIYVNCTEIQEMT